MKLVDRTAHVLIIDSRGIPVVSELKGPMQFPELLLMGGHKFTWNIPEFKEPLHGALIRADEHTVVLGIPLMADEDAEFTPELGGRVATSNEVVDLFLKFEPKFAKINQQVR